MKGMFLHGLGTAVPPHCYTQQECWDALNDSEALRTLAPRARAILKKVLCGQNGIETRHLALENLQDAFALQPDVLHRRFAKEAPALAGAAAAKALAAAKTEPGSIEAVIVSTCTGYMCPGLTSYVIESLGLPDSTLPLDLVGQGCGAAMPALAAAEALIRSGQRRTVLVVCVEVCSAAFYLDNDPGVLISACLFGDGAAAAVLSDVPGQGLRVRWTASGSLTDPRQRELLRFEQSGGMLRNILMPEVPGMAAAQVERLLGQILESARVSREEVRGWVLHPGGRDVLKAVQTRLGLTEKDLGASARILKRYGNLSSPSVLFVLNEALSDSVPRGRWWMSSFGAGFSCHGALLEVG